MTDEAKPRRFTDQSVTLDQQVMATASQLDRDRYPDCPSCQVKREPGTFGPRHQASDRCESGKRPHCSCDVCF